MTNYKVYHSDLTVSGSSFLFICGRVINTSLGICESVDPFIVGDVIKGKGGRVIGIFQMSGDAGMIVGPIVVGAISDLYSFRVAFAATAVIFSLVLILGARLPETRKMAGSHEPTISLNDN